MWMHITWSQEVKFSILKKYRLDFVLTIVFFEPNGLVVKLSFHTAKSG